MTPLPLPLQNWLDLLRTTELSRTTGQFHDPDNDCYCALGFLCLANNQPPTIKDGAGNWPYCDKLLGRDLDNSRHTAHIAWRWDNSNCSPREFAHWLERYLRAHFLTVSQ